ncbi:hypothetical protein CBR_g38475 [Chara braunii]|uniref:Complex 1 LYR protein domain-containing protein n=1 Tax=Chara braunii TaxID=69332 RepID=A0A388JNP6_CHABU|nr:hypothetical protein CBR_g38475 [Chara braunii]|eukprot:GBG59450.1 hypothetical protein CBR_g38475 [Chara braunii]
MMAALAPSPAEVRALFRSFMKAGKRFASYNMREYTKRRVREGFRETQNLQDPGARAQAFAKGKKDLEVVKRQSILYSLYSPPVKSIMELHPSSSSASLAAAAAASSASKSATVSSSS